MSYRKLKVHVCFVQLLPLQWSCEVAKFCQLKGGKKLVLFAQIICNIPVFVDCVDSFRIGPVFASALKQICLMN